MPEPVEHHIAGHIKVAKVVFCASSRHHALRSNVIHDLRMADRLMRPPSLDAKGAGIHQEHRNTAEAKSTGHRQSMVSVEDDVIYGVDHNAGPHGAPSNVHVSALSNPWCGRGLVRTKFAEVHEGGAKLHTTSSITCDKDMSSRRRTRHGRW